MMEEILKDSKCITLIADGEHITCDKAKLRAASSYFGAMFSSDMKESKASEIQLKAVEGSLLKILVAYAENNQEDLEFTEYNAQELLQLACMLQFNTAADVIEKYLLDNMTHNNCCCIMVLADSCGLNALYNKARTTAEWWFDDVAKTEGLLDLPHEVFSDLVSSETLHVNSEKTVFEAVELWLMHSFSERSKYLSGLISCIKWGIISEIDVDNLMETSSLCKEIGVKEQVLDLWKKQSTQETKPKPRAPPEVLVVLGGEWVKANEPPKEEEIKEKLIHYDALVYGNMEGSDSGHYKLTSLPEEYTNVWGYEACIVGKDIYLFGGEKKGPRMRKDWYKSVWCYDSMEDTWRKVTELPTPRRHLSIAVIGSVIYVIGGFSRYRLIQNTVDKYDTVNDTWEKQPPLTSSVFCPAACSCNGSIYVITDSIEVLHPGSNTWKEKCGILPSNVSVQCALSHETSIYMLAIYNKSFYSLDTVTDQLTKLEPFKHTFGKACRMNDKIFLVAGDDTLCIEQYSLKEKTFTVTHYQSQPLRDHHVLALPKYPAFRKV